MLLVFSANKMGSSPIPPMPQLEPVMPISCMAGHRMSADSCGFCSGDSGGGKEPSASRFASIEGRSKTISSHDEFANLREPTPNWHRLRAVRTPSPQRIADTRRFDDDGVGFLRSRSDETRPRQRRLRATLFHQSANFFGDDIDHELTVDTDVGRACPLAVPSERLAAEHQRRAVRRRPPLKKHTVAR